jgi:predicted metal-dependent hydrolase
MDKKNREQELGLDYNVDYRNIRYPRLEYKTGQLLLVLPKNYQKEKDLMEKHKRWIDKKNLIIKSAMQEAENKTLELHRSPQEFQCHVQSIVRNLQRENDSQVSQIYFRKMRTKWGSLSQRRNLTINTLLNYLPEELITYVVYHELTHTRERKHNQAFWNLIDQKFKDYQTKEKDLLIYWFLVQEKLHSSRNSILNAKQRRKESARH